MTKLTHISAEGNPNMVDISGKAITNREATAESRVKVTSEIMDLLKNDEIHTKKGPVFQTAMIAGVMAAKKTADLIPFCHQLPLSNCAISIKIENQEIIISCLAKTTSQTGVEMEALTGASLAALTVYDMCKAMSHDIVIKETKLMAKSGGKSDFKR